MSAFAGPEIVNSGLVLALDAGNTKSYPGTGTTWTDLSGSGNNGTLTNGPTYSSTNGGSIVFDGTNDYADFGNTSSLSPATAITIESWIKGSNFSTSGNIVNKNNNQGYRYRIGTTGIIQWYVKVDNGNFLESNVLLSTNQWYQVVATGDSSGLKIYYNGQLDKSGGTAFSPNYGSFYGSVNLEIGGATIFGEYFNGNIPIVRIYNRALSAAEIQQNFNALRGRFGV